MKSQNSKCAIKSTAIIFAAVAAAAAIVVFLSSAIAFGDVETPAMVLTAPGISEWTAFLTAVAGVSGLGTMGLVALAIQGGMLVIRQFQPKWKLLAVTGGTLALGVTTLAAQGLDWKMALMHSSTLAAAQVFGYEVIKTIKAERNSGSDKKTMIV